MTATIHTPRYYVEKSSNLRDAPADQYEVLLGSEDGWLDEKIYYVGSQQECKAAANRLNGNDGSCIEIISQ